MKDIIAEIICLFIVLYIVLTFGFTYFACPRNDYGCRCLINSISKNMSIGDKIVFLVNGAHRQDLIAYLDFGDAIKCALTND